MDFAFTTEQEAFRQEVRAFIQSALPADYDTVEQDELDDAGYALAKRIQQQLAERRWLCIGWPEQYGGGGKGIVEQAIFNEEMAYWRVPRVYGFGPSLIGPTLMIHGTDDQKARHLPAIASGEVAHWQAFSEPGAGSDLASLTTRADRDGDDYIVNGQKVYIGNEYPVDALYTLVRTDQAAPKHRGLTLFLIDSDSAGITYLPLKPLAGARKNQIFFENVRVPASAIVGRVNEGWGVAMTSLGLERSGLSLVANMRRTFDEFVDYCRDTGRSRDAVVAAKLVELHTDLEVLRLLAWRNVYQQEHGVHSAYESSQQSFLHKRFGPAFAAASAEILGPIALVPRGSRLAPMLGRIEHLQRHTLLTHGGGTPEILQNIIATRGLGLPRGG